MAISNIKSLLCMGESSHFSTGSVIDIYWYTDENQIEERSTCHNMSPTVCLIEKSNIVLRFQSCQTSCVSLMSNTCKATLFKILKCYQYSRLDAASKRTTAQLLEK